MSLPRVVAFDFDDTISSIHSTRIPKEQFMSLDLTECVADPLLFRNLVLLLLRSGIQVAITSYGYKDLILHTMGRIFGGSPKELPTNEAPDKNVCPFNERNVITPSDASSELSIKWPEGYEPPKGYSKSTLIACLQKHLLIDTNQWYPESSILLIDDSITNYYDALQHSYCAKLCRHLCRKHGLECLCRESYSDIPLETFQRVFQQFIICP